MLALAAAFARIVAGIVVFEAERADGVDLAHVLAGLRPVEMPSAAGQDDEAARRIGLDLVAVELIAEADIEDARYYGVDPVLRMPMRMSLTPDGALTRIT